MKQLVFTADALRTLDRMPANTSSRIREKLVQYAKDPHSFVNNVKASSGSSGLLRMRIGDWRVLFTENGEVIRIVRVAPRGSAYGGLRR